MHSDGRLHILCYTRRLALQHVPRKAHFMASFSERIAQWTLPMLRSCTYSARSTCACAITILQIRGGNPLEQGWGPSENVVVTQA